MQATSVARSCKIFPQMKKQEESVARDRTSNFSDCKIALHVYRLGYKLQDWPRQQTVGVA